MSLTTVSTQARKTIRYSIYFVIFAIIAKFIIQFGLEFYARTFPTPPPPPNHAFGPLPEISWKNPDNLPTLEYKLETADGSLPSYPNQIQVFRFIKGSVNLGTIEEAVAKAKSLGFDSTGEEISPTVLRFKSQSRPQTLELDSVSGIFSISYNLIVDPSPVTKIPPAPTTSAVSAKGFLSRAGTVPDDITNGNFTHQFLTIENEKLIEVSSLSESKLIKINLFRKDTSVKVSTVAVDLPSVTKNYFEANVWFYVGSDGVPFAGEYKYYPIDKNIIANYPIKNTQDAINELAQGKGYISNLGENKDGKITIRKGFLAYFDSENLSDQFVQPVYVFLGDRNFAAYVPAITNEYYGQLKK